MSAVGIHNGETRSLRKAPSSGYPPYGEYVDPSRFWGERLGLPEIYDSYDRVLEDKHAHTQSTVLSRKKPGEHDDKVAAIFRWLVKEYPELPAEMATTATAMRHIVFGCVSKFSPEDIRFYLAKPPAGRDDGWRARKLHVERLAGNWHFEWCPSFVTLDRIEARLREMRPDNVFRSDAGRQTT